MKKVLLFIILAISAQATYSQNDAILQIITVIKKIDATTKNDKVETITTTTIEDETKSDGSIEGFITKENLGKLYYVTYPKQFVTDNTVTMEAFFKKEQLIAIRYINQNSKTGEGNMALACYSNDILQGILHQNISSSTGNSEVIFEDVNSLGEGEKAQASKSLNVFVAGYNYYFTKKYLPEILR